MSYKFLAPAPNAPFNTSSGTTYTSDGFSIVTVPTPVYTDIRDLLNMGLISLGIAQARSNLAATVDPTINNDGTQDYGSGSAWENLTTGVRWNCVSSATGAAIWVPEQGDGVLLGYLNGANFNVTTDQAINLTGLAALNKFRITKITAKNASISLTTAAGGIYGAASKAGTPIVAATQVYTSLSASTLALDLTIATTPGLTLQTAATPLFLSLTTGQGAAATADLYVFGDIYTK